MTDAVTRRPFFTRPIGIRNLFRSATGLLAAGALAACAPTGNVSRGTVNPSQPVQVALLLPQSANASDRLVAQNLENAARLAIADLQGVSIDLRVYDTAGNPTQASAMALRAADEGAKIILGPIHAQDANAAGSAVASRGINVLSFSNNSDIAGGNVFVLGQTFSNSADRLMRFAAGQGRRDIVVVSDPDASGQVGRRAIETAAAANGIRVAGAESYELSQQGVTAAAPNIATTVRNTGASGVFFTAGTAGALPMLTQLLRDNGIDPNVTAFYGLTRWDVPASAVTTPSLQGGYFAVPDPSITAQFNARYAGTYGAAPHPLAALAYDGIAAIGAALRSGRADPLGRASLTQPSGFVGANGVFRFTADGSNQRALAVAQLRDNRVEVVENAPRSFSGAGS